MAAAPQSLPPSAQLFGYGLLFGGAAIVGKLMIDGLIENMDEAKQRRSFIGPIEQKPVLTPAGHASLSDFVRLAALGFSIYNLLAKGPDLIAQWGQVERTVQELTK